VFRIAPRRQCFATARLGQRALDLRPDAQRVAVTAPAPGTKRDRVTSILNFFDELRRLAPAGRG